MMMLILSGLNIKLIAFLRAYCTCILYVYIKSLLYDRRPFLDLDSFRVMSVAGHGKFSVGFLFFRRRKTANLIDS